MTLNDVSSLLHLPIEGMLVAHEGSMPRTEAMRRWCSCWGLMWTKHGIRWKGQMVPMHNLAG